MSDFCKDFLAEFLAAVRIARHVTQCATCRLCGFFIKRCNLRMRQIVRYVLTIGCSYTFAGLQFAQMQNLHKKAAGTSIRKRMREAMMSLSAEQRRALSP